MPPTTSPVFRRTLACIMALAFVLRLVYMLYTHRVWEDALITVQHSEDFVRGLGLTHPVPAGEGPLHGFTSPLSVLIPLLGDLMRVGFGITFLKLVSLFAGAASAWFGAQIVLELGLGEIFALFVALFLAVEHHQILWGMAGMETQVVTLCYLFVLWSALRGSPWQKGISLGLAMLARPDALFLVGLAFAYELWRDSASRKRDVVPMLGGLAIVYAPWLLFTKIYYGSPVPNTILAKGFGYKTVPAQLHGLPLGNQLLLLRDRFLDVFGSLEPSYAGNGTRFQHAFSQPWLEYSVLFTVFYGLLIAIRRRDKPALLVFAYTITYALYLTIAANIIFGWYTVPVAAGGVICAAYGLSAIVRNLADITTRQRLIIALGTLYILVFAIELPFSFRSDKYVQLDIETGVRKQIGLFLNQVSFPSDTIASESLGYVGYYSRRVIYDYPGLCSRPVVRYFREHPGAGELNMMHDLKPTYIVMRPVERYNWLGKDQAPWLDTDYDLIRDFRVTPFIDRRILKEQMNIDREFFVFRRKGAPNRETPAT